MIHREEGFSLVELMITMAIFVFVIAALSQVFASLLVQFKQQSKITETAVEGIIGTEILMRDIDLAGYGLPWDVRDAAFAEADNAKLPCPATVQDEEDYNDAPDSPPRALVSGDGEGQGGADVIVVKSTAIAINEASQKWTHLFKDNIVTEWQPESERLGTSDRVIVISPAGNQRKLVVVEGKFSSRYAENGADKDSLKDAGFAPSDDSETRIVYGVTPPASPVTTPLRMPFNRADYYVRTPAANMPSRCAAGTGILYKGTLNQGTSASSGGGLSELPLVDCVADMQVVYRLDSDGDGDDDLLSNDISALSAYEIRDQVMQVSLFILAQEGQQDITYVFDNYTGADTCATCVRVGVSAVLGRDFDLSAFTGHENYRWKVHTLSVRPGNLK